MILYHALGANLTEGIRRFETSFLAAESEYHLDDIDSLLDLLADPTLHEPRRLAWYHYFKIRRELLRYHLKEAKRLLDAEIEIDPEDIPMLQPRLRLLQGQIKVMRGEWIAGITILDQVVSDVQANGEAVLTATAEEWIARAYLGRAQSAGGWEEPTSHGIDGMSHRFWDFVLLPFYAIVWVYLGWRNERELWRPMRRYGANYSNWPIFWYYLQASRALNRAREIAPHSDTTRRFRLEIMQLGLSRYLLALRETADKCTRLLETLPVAAQYERAVVKHEFAQVLLRLHRTKTWSHHAGEGQPIENAGQLLEDIHSVYAAVGDNHSIAYVDLLLGDVCLTTTDPEAALDRWQAALRAFSNEVHPDIAGTAEALGRVYSILDGKYPQAIKDRARTLLQGIERQVFVVRLTNRLFRIIQSAGWVVPMLLVLAIAIPVNRFAALSSTEEMRDLAHTTFSLTGLAIGGAAIFAAAILSALLGLLGLVCSLRAETIRLDYFVVDQSALCRYDSTGVRQAMLCWEEITSYLRIERELWLTATKPWSFVFLRDVHGTGVHVPCTTAWFGHLQEQIERLVGHAPNQYRLPRFGLQFLGLAIVVSVTAAASIILTQGNLPRISVPVRAWSASFLTFAHWLILIAVVTKWIIHYVHVNCEVVPGPQLALAGGLSGIVLIVAGSMARPLVLMWGPVFVACGTLLLLAICNCYYGSCLLLSRRILVAVASATIVLIGFYLVLRSMLPILVNAQAFTYLGVAGNMDLSGPTQPEALSRSTCFERMGQAGQWMVAVDSTYSFGYMYIGYTAYYEGSYQASLDAFNRAIDHSGKTVPADFFYCRALAYHKLGLTAPAGADCEVFVSAQKTDKTTCELLFPEDSGLCGSRSWYLHPD
jgi:tetratricopeptide (TPR) repeat protein